jgi:hypothetical protein
MKAEKILSNAKKIGYVSGFYITSYGDETVGIKPYEWIVNNKFYFDSNEELQEFVDVLKTFFYNYCGDVTIETFEQRKTDDEDKIKLKYDNNPVRYLIRDRGYGTDTFKQADSCGMYSSDVGAAIHFELPKYIDVNGDYDTEVIPSSDPEFNKIIRCEANRLEREINTYEQKLRNAKLNLKLIMDDLNFGV